MPTFAHAVYFWFSLFFLILRALAVSLYAAEIYDESKKPIDVLRSVPHDSWCVEVQRFSEEVVNGKVALSGRQFFFITRQLILSVWIQTNQRHFIHENMKFKCFFEFIWVFQVAGTIVTYELVLYQFNDEEERPQEPCPALNATQ